MTLRDSARDTLKTAAGEKTIYRIEALQELGDVANLPYTIKILLESCLRNSDQDYVDEAQLKALASYDAANVVDAEIAFMPGRVILQDFTGVPAVVDLAAMASAMKRMGGDPKKVNPLVPCDLVIDHSIQVDAFGSPDAERINVEHEFSRNRERYEFLKWGTVAFNNFRAVPPATGIVHQVNLEYLAKAVWEKDGVLYPDSLVGTDSHTTMINGLGVLGWGVGGIEAEAVMLGQPVAMLIPEVVGFKLTGKPASGTTATDLVLRIVEMLRELGVVGKFVEFFGEGLADMSLATRATIANMAPEYGATCGFFPIDDKTLDYLRLSGREDELIDVVEKYSKAQGLWRDDSREIKYSATLELDMSEVVPALSGPKRPQDRINLSDMQSQWRKDVTSVLGGKPAPEQGCAGSKLEDGSVVIAAITSCTNTSNPSVMLGAGLLARNAVAKGLKSAPWVKTSLGPGSKVVTDYLKKAGVMGDLEALGFHVVGYGCTTCIGNSGPLPEKVSSELKEKKYTVASVLSGNRNFEGRIHQLIQANYLASPALVVAYAIAGTVDIDLTTQPLGVDADGQEVFLKDIWPSDDNIAEAVANDVTNEQFKNRYANVFEGGPEAWKAVKPDEGELYNWDSESTYIQEPDFFQGMTKEIADIESIKGARCLLKLADSVTTDHISPAGAIGSETPAGKYLISKGVKQKDFNSYGSRRGNHHVMTRGTFANIRVRNQLAPDTEGGWTTDYTDGQVKYVYDAAVNYMAAGTPLVVLAGKDYGMGSSRDWAAKGTLLLGVKAVIAESYERIHRSNLIGMGVLPLTYLDGQSAESLGLKGDEVFDIEVPNDVQPKQVLKVKAGDKEFEVNCELYNSVEVDYYRNGGILHTVLRRMA